ncbi:MAG: glycosyltransferase family 4 protein [Pseudomonadota bacterium]
MDMPQSRHLSPARCPRDADAPLRICLLSYRSNPHSGGQGVYIKNLSRALKHLGHRVDVLTGPPQTLNVDPDINVHRLACLDLYDPSNPFRIPTLTELSDPVNLMEWLGVATMGFPEPFTFGLRAWSFLRKNGHRYDIIHDNQSLSYGVWAASRSVPSVATIHHPITVDLRIAMAAAKPFWEKLKQLRWYAFIPMQKQVARRLHRIITVSECARRDIVDAFGIRQERCITVPNGIDTQLFRPLPGIQRDPNRVIVTNSADTPLKGLGHLLTAVDQLRRQGRAVKLVVIGAPKKNGVIERQVRSLDVGRLVTFTGRVSDAELVRQYARASVAVVPSEYEGFGLPVGEAMACGVPVVSSTGGALPEVVGEAGVLVPPADPQALAAAITRLLEAPAQAEALGWAGYRRVQRHFSWEAAARKTITVYRETIDAYHRP